MQAPAALALQQGLRQSIGISEECLLRKRNAEYTPEAARIPVKPPNRNAPLDSLKYMAQVTSVKDAQALTHTNAKHVIRSVPERLRLRWNPRISY